MHPTDTTTEATAAPAVILPALTPEEVAALWRHLLDVPSASTRMDYVALNGVYAKLQDVMYTCEAWPQISAALDTLRALEAARR